MRLESERQYATVDEEGRSIIAEAIKRNERVEFADDEKVVFGECEEYYRYLKK